jgi:hypothetical protein
MASWPSANNGVQLNRPLRRGSHPHQAILPFSNGPARSECVGGCQTCITGRKLWVFIHGLLIHINTRIGNLTARVVGSSCTAVKIISFARFMAPMNSHWTVFVPTSTTGRQGSQEGQRRTTPYCAPCIPVPLRPEALPVPKDLWNQT